MDFGLTQDQLLLKDTIRRFLEEQCPTTRVRQVMDGPTGHDPELWSGLVDLGVTGLYVDAQHGGAGLELLDLALAAEELGYNATPGPFLGNALAQIALALGGDDEQRRRFLPQLTDGSRIGTFALGEADGEWRPEKVATRAERGRLTGTKVLVPYGSLADVLVVAARDEDGPGLWLVEQGAAGMKATDYLCNDLTRRLSQVELDGTPGVELPGGAAAAARVRDAGCVLLAADAFGGCRRMLDMAVSYAKQREQFGQIIGAFQAVKHQLANLACELEPTLSLWWYAAHAFDRIQDESAHRAALAKALLSDTFDRFARDTTELHGGIGFTWEFDLHLWFRRAIFDRSFLGDANDHRARAAELAGW
ncbi:MAG: acyl-CoA dehydrogenase family protein [Thermodesulfobacteriota bacterium]